MSVKAFLSTLPLLFLALACTKNGEEKVSLPENKTPAPSAEPAQETKPEALAETKAAADPVEEKTLSEKSETAKPALDAKSARLIGEVEAGRKAQLAFRVSGYLKKIHVKEGDLVKKGEPIAELDSRDFQIRYEQSLARLKLSKVLTTQASKDFDRERRLREEKVATDVSFDRASSAAEQAVLNEQLAELEVANAKRSLDESRLIAPYDVVVSAIHFEENEFVRDGNTVAMIYDLASPEIKLNAPERFSGQVAVGAALTVNVPSARFSGEAKVTRIVPVISEQSRTFTIYATIDGNDAGKLSPGSYAEAVIQ